MKVAHEKRAAALIIIVLAFATTNFLIGATQAQSLGSLQADFLSLVNAERASLGKNPLSANSQLESAAYLHSKDMGDNDYFDHTSLDGTTFSQRITAAGYQWRAASENIAMAYGAPSAAKVYDMWRNSPGHYANMIGDYTDAGLGVYTINGYTYYTLDLGRGQLSPTQTPTPKPTASPTPMPYPTATPTPNPTASSTPVPTAAPTPTPKPTTTPTQTPTQPPTASPTPKPTSSLISTATPSPTPKPTTSETTATPTPDPTTTATTSPTKNPISINVNTPDPTPTPSIPELPVYIVGIMLLALSLATVVKLKTITKKK